MPETYTIKFAGGRPEFTPTNLNLPDTILASSFNPGSLPADYAIACRMGDPDLLQCIVWQHADQNGGIFVLHDKNGALLAAKATSALDYAAALGYFGELTANARYGVDVFENMEEPDD